MADTNAALEHIQQGLKALRETSAASFPETTVSRAIKHFENAEAALGETPAEVEAEVLPEGSQPYIHHEGYGLPEEQQSFIPVDKPKTDEQK